MIVPPQLVEANEEVVKYAPFILVLGKLEKDGAAINVVGRKFQALEAGAIVHTSHDFH